MALFISASCCFSTPIESEASCEKEKKKSSPNYFGVCVRAHGRERARVGERLFASGGENEDRAPADRAGELGEEEVNGRMSTAREK